MIEFFVAYAPLIQVIFVVLVTLVAASILVWIIIGAILWFVRGTHDSTAETVESEWFDEG